MSLRDLPGLLCLVVGLLIVGIGWMTSALCVLERWRRNRRPSPVLIPFIGSWFLIQWVSWTHRPIWWVSLIVASDLGTMALLIASPRLIAEWWRTSRFTRLRELTGRRGNERVTLSLHRRGWYCLRKAWDRQAGECGVIRLGEVGAYAETRTGVSLMSTNGVRRRLDLRNGVYVVAEETLPGEDWADHTLSGWELRLSPETTQSPV